MRNDREWASELADRYESGEYGWTRGQLYRRVGGEDCFCLSGGIVMQLGGEISGSCNCCVTLDSTHDGEFEDRMEQLHDFLGWPAVAFNDKIALGLTEVISALRGFAGE